ncbi:TerC family protein [Megasphaera massiliensis]|uniref:TerC family protein n=1 Tax=Megasphaera massiliensis TaxID=1232428 RepID=UPI0003FF2978|nr:TerC family protein [Megasphaera massiliensis]MBS6256781.1 TerC family protein [Megasphaera sp.]MCQ5211085.1 TerC family protein [Megasphaera massiliensis]MEE0658362.1 TerC family protein [Megasphaera massiliensis]
MELFSMQFFTALGTIILLDILLGGDNAVVIAMAANKLSPALRKKAILIGTAGAVIIRLIMTFIAVWLLTIPYLQVIGGLILLPIAVKLLVPEEHHDDVKASDNLMGAIKTIIIADAAMGVDNVLAIAGASHGSFLLVAIGFLVSIPIIVGGSTIIGRLMDRFPVILYAGAGLLGWTAGSMIGHDKILGPMIESSVGAWAPLAIQIFLAVGVIAVGLVLSRSVTAKAQG